MDFVVGGGSRGNKYPALSASRPQIFSWHFPLANPAGSQMVREIWSCSPLGQLCRAQRGQGMDLEGHVENDRAVLSEAVEGRGHLSTKVKSILG